MRRARSNPAPRDADSTNNWARYGSENSKELMRELSPLEIVIVGNTAVAHYYYSSASETLRGPKKEGRETVRELTAIERGALSVDDIRLPS